jgi:glycosyltransferase involved in cell wall biosynthesis
VDEPVEVLFVASRLDAEDGQALLNLLDRLTARGILARIICLYRGDVARHDVRVLEIPGLANRWLRALWIRRLHAEADFPHRSVLHAVHEELEDVVLALAETWRRPYLLSIDDFPEPERSLRVSRRWFRGLIAARPELVDPLVAALGVPAGLINVIVRGVATSVSVLRSNQSKVPVVGTAGRIHDASGFARFLEAARLVLRSGRDAEFLVAIRGNHPIDLRRFARSLQIADRVTVADLTAIGGRFWTVLDLYCQPSLVPSTGANLVQALAAGVPCLATRVKGLSSLIDDQETGLLVPPDDPEALALAIMQLLDDPEQAAAMADRARHSIGARFDPDVEADRLAALYRRHAAPVPCSPDTRP